MDNALRVPCARCKEPLLVWVDAGRFYVGCPYKGCALTALPREADGAINIAWHGSQAAPAPTTDAFRHCTECGNVVLPIDGRCLRCYPAPTTHAEEKP